MQTNEQIRPTASSKARQRAQGLLTALVAAAVGQSAMRVPQAALDRYHGRRGASKAQMEGRERKRMEARPGQLASRRKEIREELNRHPRRMNHPLAKEMRQIERTLAAAGNGKGKAR